MNSRKWLPRASLCLLATFFAAAFLACHHSEAPTAADERHADEPVAMHPIQHEPEAPPQPQGPPDEKTVETEEQINQKMERATTEQPRSHGAPAPQDRQQPAQQPDD